ncbi:peptidase C19, ubiquitin carboxyl-terminal hydrolase 2 [Leucogyrophana mollusca]|uniref:Peptidase C19, ubiquitin carboxyl-terminal hydrolase 2 n=1 Tax=Leucogyrophana mollusca TaxID=85980 RepID=A0ACB8BDJ2_9AGAM|nr:peptidase C19, ubiquitin carboxyl-terminal hydrolase 2 [Leucogyrophana mollusca]
MAKQKSPTPQEIYKARKAREEQEKNALLPPGLVNHGNTCFMNSVLQGLIATHYLSDLVQFQPIPPAVQHSAITHIAARRSPELTNGHGLGGDHEMPWVAGMPIGDQFVYVLLKAWSIQSNRQRESMSPREILASLGQKYDQYLDFRQQDAHEFLRQLLDAMRMEEVDVIKKRQPPPPEKGQKSQSLPLSKAPISALPNGHPRTLPIPSPLAQVMNASLSSDPPIPPGLEEEKLMSFVDMLFGGQLTSILVCQTCKHVSHTYEDFNDLSLSIKADDYARERKRDKLRQLAKKLRNISGTALGVGVTTQRSSSVPATPNRDSALDSPEISDPHRRRSIDLADVDVAADSDQGPKAEEVTVEVVPVDPPPADVAEVVEVPPPTLPPVKKRSGDHVDFLESEKPDVKEKKEKDESWAKLSRRISVTVGLSKQSKEYRRRSREEKKEKKEKKASLKLADETPQASTPPVPDVPSSDTTNVIRSPDVNAEREPTSLSAVNDKLQAQLATVKRSLSPVPRPSPSPAIPATPRFPLIARPRSPSISSKRSKPPRPPKLNSEEAAYLRDILADINPGGPSNPFSIFKQPKDQSTSTPPSQTQNLFLKINQLGGIEECLRLFTSVEVLDGENMVGCHRCWKIANGLYKPKPKPKEPAKECDSCTDSDEEKAEGVEVEAVREQQFHTPEAPHQHDESALTFRPHVVNSSSPASPSVSVDPSPSSSVTSLQDTSDSHDTSDTLPSDLSTNTTIGSRQIKPPPPPPYLALDEEEALQQTTSPEILPATYGGRPIPLISTTGPESPLSPRTARPMPSRVDTFASSTTQSSMATSSSSRASLLAPRDRHKRQRERRSDSLTESTNETSDEESELSVYSDASSAPSPALSPNASHDNLSHPPLPKPSTSDKRSSATLRSSGVPRSKQVIMRSAYKRYLIATPPPVLVIHLKRFQQISKTPVLSFSSGFKKLDDYVSFPEYLDLAPYLAPKKEDYLQAKLAEKRGRMKRAERCSYRLYAVVVHIGNMLGGHYIAYTALPPSANADASQTPQGSESMTPSATDKPQRDWAYISDTVVRLSSLDEVLKSKAYICMYERI